MTKSEQERLYKHHVALSINGRDPLHKAKHKKYADAILVSYPEFKEESVPIEEDKKEEVVQEQEDKPKTKSKGKK